MARWGIEWLVRTEGGVRTVPALVFLKDQPSSVRIQLLATVDAVRTIGPDRWKDHTSHKAMSGDLSHLHYARDKHDQTLYRLFLLWQRTEHRVIVIDGRAKPNNTTLSDAEYEAVRKLAATADSDPPPVAVADDIAREMLRGEG